MPHHHRQPESGERPVILVADDDQDILDLVVFRFERAGFDVLAATDGAQALELAFARTPDCAVLDIVMPKLDGIEVMRRLRETEATSAVPVLLLTARSREADVVSGLNDGADDYVTKPFSTLELLARVRVLLHSTRLTDEEVAGGGGSAQGLVDPDA